MPSGGARPPCPVSSPPSPAPSLPPGQTRGRAGWNAALSEVRHRGPQPTAVADGTETAVAKSPKSVADCSETGGADLAEIIRTPAGGAGRDSRRLGLRID